MHRYSSQNHGVARSAEFSNIAKVALRRTGKRSARLAAASLIGAVALSGGPHTASATTQTSTWAGTTTNWNVASNWSPNNAIPNNGNASISDFNVVINSSATQPTLSSNVTIDSLTLGTGASLILASAVQLNIAGPTVSNNGLIQIDTFSSNADLNFTANTTLSGTGSVFLDDYDPYAQLTTSAGATLTNNQTIYGIGEIDAALINNGTVNANATVGNRILILQTNNMVNNSLIEASSTGILTISGITVTQGANGTISNAGGTVNLTNANITGGSLSGGNISVSNANFTNVTVAAGTTVTLQPGTTLNYSGATFTNNGLIQVDTFAGNADLNFTGNTTLSGTGSIFLNDYNPYAQLTTSVGATLTNNQTIYGIGEIDAALVNNGTINANSTVGSHTLVLQTNNKVNNSLIEASATGILSISNITITQGTNGVISNQGATVNITGATISGGSITGGLVNVTNSNFTNVTVASGATVFVVGGATLNYTGPTLTNNGLIQVANQGAPATLNFTSNTTLTGSGSVLLYTWNPNAAITTSTGAVLTNNQTINGLGEIDAALINNGTINANANFGSHTLTLQTNNMTNNGLFEASVGGILTINGITVTQNASGVISNAGGTVNITGATISGGTISGGTVTATSTTLANLTIASSATVFVPGGTTLTYSSATLTNNGLIQVSNLGAASTLNFTSNTTLTGTGSVFLDTWNPNAAITSTAGAVLTSNQTINGLGEIDAPLINNASVIANVNIGNKTLNINGVTTNNGLIQATNGGILAFGSTAVLPNGSLGTGTFQVDANSIMSFPTTFTTNAGSLVLTDPTSSVPGLTSLTNSGNISLVTGSTLTLSGSLTGTASGALTGNGTLIAGSLFGNIAITGGTVKVANNGTTTGTSKLTALTIAGPTNAWTSDLDLTNNKLVVEDSVNHAATLATLQSEAFYGRSHATGITSSALPAGTVIAVADNAAFATPFTTFGGQPVDSNSILVAPELLGDADFSGKVDLSDLNIVLNHLGVATSAWTSGNFDGGSTIDLTDLNDVLNNLGVSFNNPNVSPADVVPEPASLALVGVVAPLLLRRRRR